MAIYWNILGPYLNDGKNNDAVILNQNLREGEGLLKWAEEKDISVLDRGFRDSLDMIITVGLKLESPFSNTREVNNIQHRKPTCHV